MKAFITIFLFLEMAFIYRITNTESGKCYIGETKCKKAEERWRQHKETIRRGAGCPALRDAVKKYGIDKFTFEVIRECSLLERFELEKQLIKEYNTQAPNGYNILPGGEGGGFLGKRHKPETITKIIETQRQFREQNPDHFETYREKHRVAVLNSDIGNKVKSSEVFQKAREEGRVGAANWKTTKTPEEMDAIKKKISKSLTEYFDENGNARNKHQEIMTKALGTKIDQYSLDGLFVATHDSIRGAARALNKINHYSICKAIELPENTAYGFKWRRHEPKE